MALGDLGTPEIPMLDTSKDEQFGGFCFFFGGGESRLSNQIAYEKTLHQTSLVVFEEGGNLLQKMLRKNPFGIREA